MNQERIEELDRLMASLKPEQFDIKTWCDKSHPCGTAACIGGWAAMHPPFIAQGLRLESGTMGSLLHPTLTSSSGGPTKHCFTALTTFFDLPASGIFDPACYREDPVSLATAQAVIKAIAEDRFDWESLELDLLYVEDCIKEHP